MNHMLWPLQSSNLNPVGQLWGISAHWLRQPPALSWCFRTFITPACSQFLSIQHNKHSSDRNAVSVFYCLSSFTTQAVFAILPLQQGHYSRMRPLLQRFRSLILVAKWNICSIIVLLTQEKRIEPPNYFTVELFFFFPLCSHSSSSSSCQAQLLCNAFV